MGINCHDGDLGGTGEFALDGFGRLVHGSWEVSDSQHHFTNLRTETSAEMCFDQPGERVLIGLGCLVGGGDIIVEHVNRQSDTVHEVRAGLVGPLFEV